MKTITPFELQMLIDKRYVEVIDVRSKNDFEVVHALVARSVPLTNFEPHSVLARRRGEAGSPIYIFGERNAQASLAACALGSAGLAEPIVIDGGMEAWTGQVLPVVRRRRLSHAVLRSLKPLTAWVGFVQTRIEALACRISWPTLADATSGERPATFHRLRCG